MSSKTPRLEVNDIFDEMSDEIKRLKSDLKFANKCLKTLNEFKKYLNEIRPQIEPNLDTKQKQELNALENRYQIMIKSYNKYIKTNTTSTPKKSVVKQNVDISEVNSVIDFDHNYYIKEEIVETTDYSNTELIVRELQTNTNTTQITRTEEQTNDFLDINGGKDNNIGSETGVTPNVCDWVGCGYVADNYRKFYDHKRLKHITERKFRCDLCEYQSFRPHHLKSHKLAKHSTDRPFKCDLCGNGFITEANLSRHSDIVHLRRATFKCTYADCNQVFRTFHKRYAFN